MIHNEWKGEGRCVVRRRSAGSESDIRKSHNRHRDKVQSVTEQPMRSDKCAARAVRMPSLLACLCPLLCSRRASSLMTITAKHLDGRRHKDRR